MGFRWMDTLRFNKAYNTWQDQIKQQFIKQFPKNLIFMHVELTEQTASR